ncbi:MAG: serine/threonine-protein kinase [Planctomycetota bacterium]
MATTDDTSFAKLALNLELITEKQLQKALLLQQKLRQEKELVLSLAEVLEKKGYLGLEEIQRVHQELERIQKHQEKLPGYRIVRKVGSGGMGVVYEGFDVKNERRVAIKVLPSKFANDEESRERFFREAEATQRLQHPNLIQGFEVLERNKKVYFVMEYVDGISIENEISKTGSYPEKKALYVTQEVAKALSYCHERQIIHRDIKPENILIDSQNNVKLMDLGLAKDLSQESKLTQAGMTVGTPNYIAPEQAKGTTDIDLRCDIYSLGGTLYYMVTGHIPFDGNSPLAVMNKHISEPLTPPNKLNQDISLGCNALVVKMMAKNPKHRYQNAQEILKDILRIEQGENLEEIPVKQLLQKNPILRNPSGTRSGTRSGIRKAQPKARKRQMLMLSLGICGLLLSFSGLIWWKSQLQKQQQLEKGEFLQLQSQIGTQQEPAEVYLEQLHTFLETYPQSPYLQEIERSIKKLLDQKTLETQVQNIFVQVEQLITEESYIDAFQLFQQSQSKIELFSFLKLKSSTLSQKLLKSASAYYLEKIQQLAQNGKGKEGVELLTQVKRFFENSSWAQDFSRLEKELEPKDIFLFTPSPDVFWEVMTSKNKVDLKKNAILDGMQFTLRAPSEQDYGGYLLKLLRPSGNAELLFEFMIEQGDAGVMFNSAEFPRLQQRFKLIKNRKYQARLVSQNNRVTFYCDQQILEEKLVSVSNQPTHVLFALEGRQASIRVFNLRLKPE